MLKFDTAKLQTLFKFRQTPCANPDCTEIGHCHRAAEDCAAYLPLTMVSPGMWVELVEITAGRKLRHRLTELGLIPGVKFRVVQDDGGPLLLAVHDSRLALGRGMAHRILVQPAQGQAS